MLVLGIESSCDETAASIIKNNLVLSDCISSQIDIHKAYGGVVPELASRNHVVNIQKVIQQAMTDAAITFKDLDGVVATSGPGLLGSLIIGLQTAKTIAFAHGLPFCGVNHLRGHLLATQLKTSDKNSIPEYPYLALLASGGHTGIYLVLNWNNISCLGETRDDAAGEAFDKVAKMLGLGYPGGPVIDKLASLEAHQITFPQALKRKDSYEFSFSGLKTAVAQYIKNLNHALSQEEITAIAKGFQKSVIETLVKKLVSAARAKQINNVVLAGGVAANSGLRTHAAFICNEKNLNLFVPPAKQCTDNASMIAYAGLLALKSGERSPLSLSPKASWPI